MDTTSSKSDGLYFFFALTALLTFLTFGVMAIFQIPGPSLDDPEQVRPVGLIVFALGGFTPSIAAFIVASTRTGRAGRRDLWRRSIQFRLGGKWYLVAIGVFVLAQGAQVAAAAVSDGLIRPWYFDQPFALLTNIPAILILGPVSEEYGWRGFALDRVLERWSRPVGNLVLGIAWALWHLPLFFIPGTSQSALGAPLPSFAIFTLQILALTVIYTWIYRKTKRSIWSAIFVHFMTTYTAFIAGGFIEGGGSFINAPAVVVLIVIAIVITVVEDTVKHNQ